MSTSATWLPRGPATIGPNPEDDTTIADKYETLLSLAEHGALKPVVGSVLPFAQIVEAHRLVDGGHEVGSVVLTFGQDG